MKRKKVAEIPKTYWWAIAFITFFVGFFSDILKERWKAKPLLPSPESKQETPITVGIPLTHKSRTFYLDTFYIGVDTVYKK